MKKYSNIDMATLLAGSSIISLSAVFTRLTTVSSGVSAFYRVLFGGIFLLIFCIVKKQKLKGSIHAFALSALAGLFFALDLYAWHKSIHYIGPGLATVLANFQVVFLAIISFLFFKEKGSWKFYLSIILALIGVLLLCGLNWNDGGQNYKIGVLLGLLTAVFYTGYMLSLNALNKIENKFSATGNIFWVCVSASIILGTMAASTGDSFSLINTKNLVLLVSYGCLCQGLGWVFISSSLKNIPIATAGLILLMQPTLSMLWDILFFKRPTTFTDLIGFTLSLGAIYLGTTKKSNKNKQNIKTEEL